ncbi:hypothetical protein BDQ12DRAFT_708429 [Crucibulum laeve]|uniref:BTB domain-containing protein n=1 Tax=Crucibulum laeve TaxID=68775 RepID=A0A5C3MHU9_9AGAR|nr:hypothetical protein BDQ12DRAFT_708429 [Crucibulum laeve]
MPASVPTSLTRPTTRGMKRKSEDKPQKESQVNNLTESSPAKRRKSSSSLSNEKGKEDTPEPEPEYHQDPDYFFEDGDIILKTENTVFCVHQRKLAELGGMFEQMFAMPQPANAARLMGLPYCDLVGLVSPRDVHILLSYAYDHLTLTKENKNGTDVFRSLHWEGATALLSVSHKYNLANLRLLCLEALELLFPKSADACSSRPIITGITSKTERALFRRRFPFQAIKLFYECDVPALLPSAYYHAAQLSIEDIVNGIPLLDGSKEVVPQNEVVKIMKGRESLKTARRTILYRWLSDKVGHGQGSRGCAKCPRLAIKGADTCYMFLMRMFFDFHRAGFFDSKSNALEVLSDDAMQSLSDYLCEPCWTNVQLKIKEGLWGVWEQLPLYFGWTGWSEIDIEQKRIDDGWNDDY